MADLLSRIIGTVVTGILGRAREGTKVGPQLANEAVRSCWRLLAPNSGLGRSRYVETVGLSKNTAVVRELLMP